MYISYPFGTSNNNDDEAAQAFLLDEVASGNLMIGNVRYNTGYAFVMAPLKSLTKTLGRLDDRTFLLLQMSLYSTIPFMVYDILRRRFDSRTALITALIVLVDPIGLQWAHFRLPGWLIATVTVWALWLAQLAWSATIGRRIALVALAAVGLGMMTIARLNFCTRGGGFRIQLLALATHPFSSASRTLCSGWLCQCRRLVPIHASDSYSVHGHNTVKLHHRNHTCIGSKRKTDSGSCVKWAALITLRQSPNSGDRPSD